MELVQTVLLTLLVLIAFGASSRRMESDGRLARVERKLDLLLKNAGLEDELPSQVSDRVIGYLGTGQKINAIKAYREDNPGVGLREAKNAVETMAHIRNSH